MDELVDIILESDICISDIADMIRREVDRRKEIESMKKDIAYKLYEYLSKCDGHWELHLTDRDNEIGVKGTDLHLPLLHTYKDGTKIYYLVNAEDTLNRFLYIDSLMPISILEFTVDRIVPYKCDYTLLLY